MKVSKWFVKICCLCFLIAGCGDGEKSKVGSLTLDATPGAASGGLYPVSLLATYTNPTKSDLVGVEITFDSSPRLPGLPVTLSTPTNGKQGINLIIPQLPDPVTIAFTASTGGLQDSKIIAVPGLDAVAATPTTLTFSAAELAPTQKTIAVSGGSTPYSASSSNGTLVTSSALGSSVSVTRVSNGVGTAVITITDAVGATTTVNVTLQ